MSTGKEMVATDKQNGKLSKQLPLLTPVVDIYENEEEILLHAEMPGVQKEHMMIHIDNGTLLVSGERKLQPDGASAWQEFGEVEFRRSFSIPQTIDVNKVQARLNDGILELHLVKSEAAKPRQIPRKYEFPGYFLLDRITSARTFSCQAEIQLSSLHQKAP